ncbi:MAG: branched-chain amino acid ABC transporter ATP-binding protein/permease [Acidimicrobiia bacterium]|nr:branched-chain amino acid ABC transporter ATP-binding protein/permease [Acidimicrobiia bacterium]
MWWATAVVGLNLLLGYAGLLSLGHHVFFLYGGFVGAVWAVEDWGLDPWLGFPAAFLAGMVFGALLALTCCHLRGFYLTVVTLAFALISTSIALLFDGAFGGLGGRTVAEPLDTAFSWIPADNPHRYLVGLYWIGAALLVIAVYVSWNLVHSRWGRAYQAIRESELAARSCGVNTYWYKVSAFSVSAGLVSLAGVLAAQTTLQVAVLDGTQTIGQSFRYVIYLFFGGLGTLAGPVVGAFVFTLGFGVDLGGKSTSEWLGRSEQLVLGVLVVVNAILLPRGLVGQVRHLRERRRPARRPGPARPLPEELARPRPRPRPGTAEAGPLLSVSGLTKRFGGLAALSAVDLAVAPGTVHALIGPNGSGKSTFVNVVTGFYRPDAGQVSFHGRDVAGLPPHRASQAGLARTFQGCQIWRRMTVLENVMVGAHSRTRYGLARSMVLPEPARAEERQVRDRARGLLRFVGLEDRADVRADALPFADQRRLEIARALAGDPDLLLLDEPAAGMHPNDLHELADLIRTVRDEGVTVLLIEHHMELVMALSDVVAVLDYGEKIAEGTPDAVRADPRVVQAYLGDHA